MCPLWLPPRRNVAPCRESVSADCIRRGAFQSEGAPAVARENLVALAILIQNVTSNEDKLGSDIFSSRRTADRGVALPDRASSAIDGGDQADTCLWQQRAMFHLSNSSARRSGKLQPANESPRGDCHPSSIQIDDPTRLPDAVTGSVTVRRLVLDDEDEEFAVKSMADQFVEAAGEEKHVAILFIDIRGFTAFAERLLAYDVIHALNRYYHRMGQIVHRHGGVIDNYMGDGILSVFDIEGSDRMVSRALQAGLDMLEAIESMKPYFEAIHGRSFDIGIGLRYGAVVVGTVGWGNYKRLTIVGDAVNFASRVESANKNAGTNFLISEDAYEQVGHEVEVNQCPPWEVRGKTGIFQLYEVVGTKAP